MPICCGFFIFVNTILTKINLNFISEIKRIRILINKYIDRYNKIIKDNDIKLSIIVLDINSNDTELGIVLNPTEMISIESYVVKSRPFYPFFMKKNFLEKEMEKEFDGKNVLSSFKK